MQVTQDRVRSRTVESAILNRKDIVGVLCDVRGGQTVLPSSPARLKSRASERVWMEFGVGVMPFESVLNLER
jgi:hypothetical protein